MEDTCLRQEATQIGTLTKRHAPFVALTKCVVISSVKQECFFFLLAINHKRLGRNMVEIRSVNESYHMQGIKNDIYRDLLAISVNGFL